MFLIGTYQIDEELSGTSAAQLIDSKISGMRARRSGVLCNAHRPGWLRCLSLDQCGHHAYFARWRIRNAQRPDKHLFGARQHRAIASKQHDERIDETIQCGGDHLFTADFLCR